ncbi:MAG: hypothetical protein ABF239_00250, partial [Wenyingzhuangia sp.]
LKQLNIKFNKQMKIKTSLNVLSIFLFFFFSVNTSGQKIKKIELEKIKNNKVSKSLILDKSQKSIVSENTIYFVNNKIISNKRLKLIPKDSIFSLNIIRRDTIVKGLKFDSQIFVTLVNSSKE